MPHLVSVSVDETLLYPTENLHVRKARSSRLAHAASATELQGDPPLGYAASLARKRMRLRQARRAASSFPLSDISHNARRSASRSESSFGRESFSSLLTSKFDENSTSISGRSNSHSAYPSPPASEKTRSHSSSDFEDEVAEVIDRFPFPLNPVPLPALKFPASSNDEVPHTPRHRWKGIETPPSTPTGSPDRFIANRLTPQEPSKTFRLSKPPNQLSVHEKVLRHNSASPDPFGPLLIPRIRDVRSNVPEVSPTPVHPRPRRPIGTTNVTAVPDPSTIQNRSASAGAVWNIGGGTLAHHPGPIRSVSNGRGGFVSGGSNAPMYTSQFFNDDTSDQDLERMEARLAAAMDIDQTARILDISRSPKSPRSVTTGEVGYKRKCPYVESRTQWKHGSWITEGSQSRKYTYSAQGSCHSLLRAVRISANPFSSGLYPMEANVWVKSGQENS